MASIAAGSEWIDEALSHVAMTRATRRPPQAVANAIRRAAAWLGPEIESPRPDYRRFEADMRLSALSRSMLPYS
jgi:hypothetical protein